MKKWIEIQSDNSLNLKLGLIFNNVALPRIKKNSIHIGTSKRNKYAIELIQDMAGAWSVQSDNVISIVTISLKSYFIFDKIENVKAQAEEDIKNLSKTPPSQEFVIQKVLAMEKHFHWYFLQKSWEECTKEFEKFDAPSKGHQYIYSYVNEESHYEIRERLKALQVMSM